MFNKSLLAITLAGTLALGSVAPALADGAASFRNILIGAGAAYYLIQSNHNRHVHNENVNLYNNGRYGTFWYNGKRVNCRYVNHEKVCYVLQNDHWEYVNPR